jgi:hypothetical protein
MVDNDASSSLMKSKSGRVGVCRGVAAADDESQLEPSEEKEELVEGQVEKEAAAEWLFDEYVMFWSKNIFFDDLRGQEKKRRDSREPVRSTLAPSLLIEETALRIGLCWR